MLWAGTPVLTFPLETLASRVAASQLHALGFPNLVAESRKEYEEIAIQLGNNPSEYVTQLWSLVQLSCCSHYRLAALKKKVQEARIAAPLFDTKKYTSDLEVLYWKMWNRYSAGMVSDHITE